MSAFLSKTFPLACAALCFLFSACAERGGKSPAPLTSLVMEGPSLSIVGEYAGMELEGGMDRTCMAGYGGLTLHAKRPGSVFSCEAELDEPPTEKGRIRGLLRCSDGRNILFSLRNIGPDQGVGIGRESSEGELMVFFYHASKEEAERRFPSVKEDITRARATGKQ